MITLRRARDRHHDRRRGQDAWFTFSPSGQGNLVVESFGSLELFSEEWLPPAAAARRHAPHDTEVLSYVHEGTLAFEDSLGRSGVIQAGEFRSMTAGRGVRHSETNASRTEGTHLFRLWLRPAVVELELSNEQKRFSIAERRGLLCVVASSDGRSGSLRIRQEAQVYSSVLDAGQHVVRSLEHGRSAWLHVVHGKATIDDRVVYTGDGAGYTDEHAISLTALEPTEILLIDMGDPLGVRDHAGEP